MGTCWSGTAASINPDPVLPGKATERNVARSTPSDLEVSQDIGSTLADALKMLSQEGGTNGPQGSDLGWLNFAIKELWPLADQAVQASIREAVEPAIQDAMPSIMKGIRFSQFSLGTNPPVLGPMSVRTKDKHNHLGLELDLAVQWQCNGSITLEIPPGVEVGIARLSLSGNVLLVLRPLLNTLPIVGGLQVTMASPPKIDWELSGLASVVQYPAFAGTIKKVVLDLLSDILVLPNGIFVHWVWGREKELDISAMQYPAPEALLRLGVVEARGLEGKDWHMFGKATSDPYAIVHVGARSHKTSIIPRTTEPIWGDHGWHDFFMYTPQQLVRVEVFDSDLGGGDDALGHLEGITILDLIQNPDTWWPLHQDSAASAPVGEVHLKLEAFSLVSLPECVQRPPPPVGAAKSSAILSIQLRSLRGLPTEKAVGAYIKISTEGKTFASNKSQYRVPWFDGPPVDPAVQRMVEFLDLEKYPVARIMEVSGLSERQVMQIIKQRPSFYTEWQQSIHVCIEDVTTASLNLQLFIPGESDAPPAEPATPLLVKKLLDETKMTSSELVTLTRRAPRGVVARWSHYAEGPFELDACFTLRGLKHI